jgi:hypothetical protein
MSVETDEANDTFELTVKLAGLDTPKAVRVTQDGENGVRVMISIESPRQVHAWARQMGTVAETKEPTQLGGGTWWYRHTVASIRREGLYIQVTAVQMALDLDDASMTEPVTA